MTVRHLSTDHARHAAIALPAILALVLGGALSAPPAYADTPSPTPTPEASASESTNTAPIITRDPGNTEGYQGYGAFFWSTATGTPTPTVQWESRAPGGGWMPIDGGTADYLELHNLTLEQSGTEYRAVHTNEVGSATSEAATLTVIEPERVAPVIEVDEPCYLPVLNVGDYCWIFVGAQGYGPFTVTWQRSATPDFASPTTLESGVSFTDVGHGWIETNYSFRAEPGDVGTSFYRVIVSNGVEPDAISSVHEIVVVEAPLSGTVPTMTKPVRVGAKVTADPGTWTPGVAFSYQWLRNGKTIAGATAKSYTPTPADRGKALSVRVTGTRAGSSPLTHTSTQVKVQPGKLAHSTPKIKGSPRVGSKVAVAPGNWTNGTKLTYQWLRNGKPIRGATAKTYTVKSTDKNAKLTVSVTGTKRGYAPLTVDSAPVKIRG